MDRQKQRLISLLALGIAAGGAYVIQAYGQGATGASQTGPTATPSSSPTTSSSNAPGTAAPINISTQLENIVALNYLHHVNTVAIQSGTNAQSVVQSQAAQTLATALVTDHQPLEQQVTTVADQKGVTLYTVQSATVETAEDDFLSTQSGLNYDQLFMQIEKQWNQEVLTNLQMLSTEVKDTDVRNLINQTIPVVQKHIQLASVQVQGGASPSPQASATPSATPSASPSSSPSPSATPKPSPSSSVSPSPNPQAGTAGGGTGY